MTRPLPIALCALLIGAAPGADIVIRGGTIHDGSGGRPITGDVEIKGDRIVYVGRSRGTRAAQIVDARGAIVAPGFIDAHTHPDSYIRSPDATARLNLPWLAQGVSTIVIGVDGYGTPDVAEDAGALTKAGIGTNVAPFVGFGAVRGRVLGQDDRAPSPAELAQEKALVAKAMCAGAYGLSTGLFYAPQSFAKTDEVVAVAREAAIRGGMYDTHQRDESNYTIGLLNSTKEAIEIGRQAGMPVHFAHLKALGVDVQGKAPELIAVIEAARKAGQNVTADQYPWLASGSSVDASLVPRWANDGGYPKLIARFDDPATLAKIKTEMAENLRRRGGKESLLLTSADMPWTGRTLGQMAALWGIDPVDAAIRILRVADATGKEPAGVSVASFNMIDADVDRIMRQPWVVTSSDGSNGHPRQYATFPRKYQVYVRERKVLTLGQFIRQSTGATADMYRMDGRGYLKPGRYADVVVFDPAGYAPRADYVNPRVPSVGVKALFVNGRLALKDGATTGAAPGRVLLRPTPAQCPAT
ncbi:amidohydrolase [Sphingomonas sp. Leaf24]|uniref:N-acyl-D-amino-acid deacylase family protein n=1 Tax=unclassified Sphingomonas TaxID=196159 RepID=UPI0006F9AE04|nr:MULTISPECIES: amidohydrolase family protein [unclassified Sphingomonas]KQM13725.1 amidohydrolase [Sphingomonas sp. Leaf5]KQM86810.1 amidohydrolase [Sphingomonas sp. Leaf24]